MLYGDGDFVFIGDVVMSFVVWFLIIVYVGDGFYEGFNFVIVSDVMLYFLVN